MGGGGGARDAGAAPERPPPSRLPSGEGGRGGLGAPMGPPITVRPGPGERERDRGRLRGGEASFRQGACALLPVLPPPPSADDGLAPGGGGGGGARRPRDLDRELPPSRPWPPLSQPPPPRRRLALLERERGRLLSREYEREFERFRGGFRESSSCFSFTRSSTFCFAFALASSLGEKISNRSSPLASNARNMKVPV